MHFLAGVIVFSQLVSALVFVAPRATPGTDALQLHQQGWSPQPTKPPFFNVELVKRQSSRPLTLIEGPDGVCGYQFGEQGEYNLVACTSCYYQSTPDYTLGLCYTSKCGFATGVDQDGELYCYDPTTSAPRPLWTLCNGWHQRRKLSGRCSM
jgi:hypothetical protein